MREERLTVEEVAKWLRLNPMTVRNVISRGELSAVHVGQRRVRIRQYELYRFLGIEPQADVSLDGRMADVLRAKDMDEMVAALRSLAAAAERLADDLERQSD